MTRVVLAVACILVIAGAANVCGGRHAPTCEDKDARIEKLSTDLRLRTAELTVTRGMLRAANKKLEQCASEE